jgi:RNA polymerase sigma-70 factor (ECF subfamily)
MVTPGTEEVFAAFHRRLRAFVSRRVRNSADVDDVLQETFLRIHRHLGAVRSSDRLAAWVFQIARNTLIDHYRRAADGRGIVEPQLPEEIRETEAEGTDDFEQVAACLAPMISSLPPCDRLAVQMTEIDGLTQGEASRRAAVSLSGMKSRVQRARRKLKAMLLECCRIELDRRGGIVEYEPRANGCGPCGCGPSPASSPARAAQSKGDRRRA